MRLFSSMCLAVVCMLAARFPVWGLEPPEVTAEAAILMDADTGQVLYGKNMHDRRHPASITKIMTGLLTVENARPDDVVEVSREAVHIPFNSSHIALTEGERLPVRDALYALMLPSANDAAGALAEHVAGTQRDFAQRMTRRAAELGARNTTFRNPSGLPDEEHLTTAYDMAKITSAAIQNPDFLQYFGTGRYTMPPTNLQPDERYLTNQQYMLLPDQDWAYNPDVIGGKVGFTDEARHTMSTAARRNGRTLVAVVLGCGVDNKFYDTQALFDYGFDAFTPVAVDGEAFQNLTAPLVDGEGQPVGEMVFTAEVEGMELLVPKGTTPELRYDPVLPEQVAETETGEAWMRVLMSGPSGEQLLAELPLRGEGVADTAVIKSGEIAPLQDGTEIHKHRVLQVVLLLIPVLVILYLLYKRRQMQRRAEIRRRRQRRIMEQRRAGW